MKYLKYIIAIVIIAGLLLIAFVIKPSEVEVKQQNTSVEHIYASWDTMEFDKCVTAWLITRFIDKDAEFVFYPQGTEISEGILFDVPGANWSRKHRKCTSQCVIETIENPDEAIKEIVSIAGKVELNFWQLDRWPQAQKCFYTVKEITDQTADPIESLRKTGIYFDKLYSDFKNKERDKNNI